MLSLTLFYCSKNKNDSIEGPNTQNPTNPPTSASVIILASGLMNPVGIAVDGTNAYWTESQDGMTSADSGITWVKKVSLSGGPVTPLYTKIGQPNYVNTWSLAIDANYVYWSESNQDTMSIRKVGKNGGGATRILAQYPYKFALDASDIYFSDQAGNVSMPHGFVGKIGKTGGVATPIGWGPQQPDFIAVYGGNVYWVSDWDQSLNVNGISGGSVTNLAYVSGSHSIAADSTGVYYVKLDSSGTKGIIKRIGLAGGAINDIISSSMPRSLVLDANDIYWTDNNGIYKANKNGTNVSHVSVTGSPWDITIDANYVYWTDNSSVRKIAKW
jgi:hypothetical protein